MEANALTAEIKQSSGDCGWDFRRQGQWPRGNGRETTSRQLLSVEPKTSGFLTKFFRCACSWRLS